MKRAAWPHIRQQVAVAVLCTAFAATTAMPAENVVLAWNDTALALIRQDRLAPPRAARALAMMHLSLLGALQNPGRIAPARERAVGNDFHDAAAATAAHDVLLGLFPTDAEACDRAWELSLATIPAGVDKTTGIDFGHRVGAGMLARRAHDGADRVVNYVPVDQPGRWRPTPPLFQPALLPQWGQVVPFTLREGQQFRRRGAPMLGSADYAAALNEVKAIGARESRTRSADQTEIALFWADGAGTATPPGHWNVIAREVAARTKLSREESALLFAMLNTALADAAIVAWDMKYDTDLWRPITAIRLADTDGNPATEADPSWTPLIATPPFPTYTSGHSTFSGAAARLLARFVGGDDFPFVSRSDGLPGVLRSFGSFSQAADEAGRSRVYGGIHFEFDNSDGLATGRALGDWVWERFGSPTLEAHDTR